jgi:hypothetical protein
MHWTRLWKTDAVRSYASNRHHIGYKLNSACRRARLWKTTPSVATRKDAILVQMSLGFRTTIYQTDAERSDENCHDAQRRELDNGYHTNLTLPYLTFLPGLAWPDLTKPNLSATRQIHLSRPSYPFLKSRPGCQVTRICTSCQGRSDTTVVQISMVALVSTGTIVARLPRSPRSLMVPWSPCPQGRLGSHGGGYPQ